MRFRKRSVEVEAMRWDGSVESIRAICGWANPGPHGDPWVDYVTMAENTVGDVLVHTLNGPVCLERGEWVVRGVAGEFYPCKPDIFEATYEPVSGGSDA